MNLSNVYGQKELHDTCLRRRVKEARSAARAALAAHELPGLACQMLHDTVFYHTIIDMANITLNAVPEPYPVDNPEAAKN